MEERLNVDEMRDRVRAAFADRNKLSEDDSRAAVLGAIDALDRGELRVAEKDGQRWIVHDWLKEAILLYFAVRKMQLLEVGPFEFHDKIPLKRGLDRAGVRVGPPGVVRHGAFLEASAIVMPGYVNIGAFVGAGARVTAGAWVVCPAAARTSSA